MPSQLPVPRPPITAETQRFWDELANGRFLLNQCADCETVIWYPRKICTSCGSSQLRELEASGRGTIYTYTVNYRGDGNYQGSSPYVLAYVELEEGPRVMTNIVECEPDELEVGAAVQLVFEHSEESNATLYRFKLVR